MNKITYLFKNLSNFLIKKFPSFYFYTSLLVIILSAYLKLIFKKYNWQKYVFYSKKVLELIKKFGTNVKIESIDILDQIKSPVIFVSNHMSSLETFLFGYLIGRNRKISFIIKKDLLRYPFISRLIKFLNPISVSRKNPIKDFKIIKKEIKNLLNKKISLVIFPQATREIKIDKKKFSSLALKIAKMYNIGIIPVFVKTDFLSIGKVIKDLGRVYPQKDVYIKFFPYIKPYEINKETNKLIIDLFSFELKKFFI